MLELLRCDRQPFVLLSHLEAGATKARPPPQPSPHLVEDTDEIFPGQQVVQEVQELRLVQNMPTVYLKCGPI